MLGSSQLPLSHSLELREDLVQHCALLLFVWASNLILGTGAAPKLDQCSDNVLVSVEGGQMEGRIFFLPVVSR